MDADYREVCKRLAAKYSRPDSGYFNFVSLRPDIFHIAPDLCTAEMTTFLKETN